MIHIRQKLFPPRSPFCCQFFQSLWENRKKHGLSIVVDQNDHQPLFWLQMRGLDSDKEVCANRKGNNCRQKQTFRLRFRHILRIDALDKNSDSVLSALWKKLASVLRSQLENTVCSGSGTPYAGNNER